MLKISKLADYATVLMSHLADSSQDCYSASETAERSGIPIHTVRKVLKMLATAGLLTAYQGSAGGYQLSRPAAQINLQELITAIDGAPAITDCSAESNTCHQANCCSIKGNWQLVNQKINTVLASVSLADLMGSSEQAIHFYETADSMRET